MKRRTFLQSLAAASAVPAITPTELTFPWFSNLALHGAEMEKAPRRLVCIGLDFGLRPEAFFPAGHGSELELTPLLKPLERWQKKMTVFSKLDHPGVQGGHYGVHAFLSGVRREQAAGFADGCVSLDQLAEKELGGLTRFPSLCLGVGGGDAISCPVLAGRQTDAILKLTAERTLVVEAVFLGDGADGGIRALQLMAGTIDPKLQQILNGRRLKQGAESALKLAG